MQDPAQQATGFPLLVGIDSAAGIARLGGNEERYRYWLTDFVVDGPATVAQIRQAFTAGHTESARQAAHALKGRVGMLGMTELHRVATSLEAALKQGDPVEGWLGRLEESTGQTSLEIRRAFGLPDQPPLPPPHLPATTPNGPMPAAVAHLLELLDASDGSSAAAIALGLEALKDSEWAPSLRQALAYAQNFDFLAARRVLADDFPHQSEAG